MNPTTHLDAVNIRKPKIKQHKIRTTTNHGIEPTLTGPLPHRVVAAPNQRAQQRRADTLVILHDQDTVPFHTTRREVPGSTTGDEKPAVSASTLVASPSDRHRRRRALGER